MTDKPDTLVFEDMPALMTNFSEYTDIKILELQKEISHLNRKSINSGYLPSLSLNGQFAV